jgi:PAS domain S-box-containing protein
MSAPQTLKVLLVEDNQNDALLLQLELEHAGYAPACHRIEARDAMASALERENWDVVIADYHMPSFSGLEALALVKETGVDLPFIIVSGQITDATAVEAMKAGAHDYVMKDNLSRLGPAVQRELREAEERRQRRESEERLKLEHIFREAIENSVPAGISVVNLDGHQTYVNPAFCRMVGWSEKELLGARPPFVYWPPEELERITDSLGTVVRGNSPTTGIELRFCRRSGERFNVLLQITPLKNSFGDVTGWVSSASDITQRKRADARLSAEHAITRMLANASSLDQTASPIIEALLEGLEMEAGILWLVDAKNETLNPATTRLRSYAPEHQGFLEASSKMSFGRGTTLPGRVWEKQHPAWLNLLEEENFQRRELAQKSGLQSAAAFPIQAGDEFFGVLEFFTVAKFDPDPTLLNMMAAIGSEIGQFIKRRTAEEALRGAHDELETRVQQRTADLKTANTRLEAAITERKRLEHELLEITEKERRRIGLDLHDDLGQKLAGVALMTKGLQLRLAKQGSDGAQDAARIHELLQQAMNHARELAKDLTTLDLKENDLPSALKNLAAHTREVFEVSCKFKAEGTLPALEPNVVTQLCKIAQEAITNAIKHGKAEKVGINLANGGRQVVLSVQNDGLPFPDLKGHSSGMGLRIMNYRARLIGASLEIKSAGTHGTRVTCTVPLA